MDPKKTLFSLTRFQKQKPQLPCWVAGRFFKKDSKHFVLKSQGFVFFCENLNSTAKYKEGSWLAVQLLSQFSAKKIKDHFNQFHQENPTIKTSPLLSGYQVGDSYLLQSPEIPYKEQAFSYQKKGAVLQNWQLFLRSVEDFFISKGLAFVETPYLVKCPGTEPHLKALKSSFKDYYLPTSPEIQLKKLLCQDWTDFFEIKTCFREETTNNIHQVEFRLLEWYRAFYSLEELLQEVYELLIFLLNQKADCKIPSLKALSVSELFQKHLRFSLHPKTSKKQLFDLAKKESLPVKKNFSFEDLFFSLFLNKIEPQIPKKHPLFIYNYPPQLRAFSQINSEGWANRFELYWKGFELANAFYEVHQFKEQKFLFQKHLKQRKDDMDWDEELLLAMKGGMPPCSGVALGLDRLFLALTSEKSLKSTRLFPF